MKRLSKLALFSGIAAVAMVARMTSVMAEETAAMELNTIDKCRQELTNEAFPLAITEKALISKGIAQSQVKEIMDKLNEQAKIIPAIYAAEYKSDIQEEPLATNDPLSEVYMIENLNSVREEVFLSVMKEYVSDAQVAIAMFNSITSQREAAIKDCGR